LARIRVIIAGAAGRDFHNFNTMFRNNLFYEVVCFTAEQIPNIEYRRYPRELAGLLYTKGIQVFPEKDMPELIRKFNADVVVLAYSDLMHEAVMHKASLAIANGADFWLLGPKNTMLKSRNKVIAVTAVRTGCGKSQTTREICRLLKETGRNVVVIRHPMPYGDLKKQACQRFQTYDDLDSHNCTIEEREEYEPLIDSGITVFAGVDYGKILIEAEKAAGKEGTLIWDGGNNDTPFYKPDLHICIADPLRPGHEVLYHPGEANFRMADVIIINKENSAKKRDIETVKSNIRKFNRKAIIIDADSEIIVENPELIRNKKVLVVEDGPTLTHGGMAFGAGYIAAKRSKAVIIDAKKYSVGSIRKVYSKYPHIKLILPAMGYSRAQIDDLEKTIKKARCDAVISGTPINLNRVIKTDKPIVRIRYNLKILGNQSLENLIKNTLQTSGLH